MLSDFGCYCESCEQKASLLAAVCGGGSAGEAVGVQVGILSVP